jgi:hemerythrin-like domain-containing protein
MESIKLLRADHEIILEALHVLDAINNEIERGKPMDKRDIRSLLDFLREFADGSHHVKEEAILFPALMQAGMTMEEGPLRVMAYEHERGRALTTAMDDALTLDDRHGFTMYSRRYIKLLTEHIEKENYVLFDIAEQTLTDDEDRKIADAFESFEQNIVGAQACRRLRDTVATLGAKHLTLAVN